MPPPAPVTLRELPGTRVLFWQVGACPYCGEAHLHLAGNARQDTAAARSSLGEVAAPCTPERSYRLTLAPTRRSRDARAERRRERREGRRLRGADPEEDWGGWEGEDEE